MKKLYLLMAILTLTFLCFAEIDEYYTFNSTTAAYTPITGTPVTDVIGDDYLSAAITIGFDFPYGDEDYSSIRISSNGWIGLGTSLTHSNLSNNLADAAWHPVLAPLWDDTSTAGGTVSTLLSGTAPNRIFTVQYEGLQWNYWAGNSINLQVKLHEDGKIQFCYGSIDGEINNPSASIGINMSPGGNNWYISVSPGPPATSSNTTSDNSITAYPGNGVVYEFLPLVASANDLAATSVTGNLTPSINAATIYNVGVRNRGTNPQSTYTVQLINAAGTVLGSVAGVTLAPGASHSFPISWTPTVEGPMQLRGKVVLTGDQNPQNDVTQPYPITVMPEGLAVITIGDGSMMDRVPVDMYWRNSLFQTLYYPQEINMFGSISAIAFYNSFVTNLPQMPVKIWLGTTANDDLSGGWIPSTALTLVFDGNVDFPSGTNTITIPLTTPFVYTGGNLVMMVNRPMDTQYYSSMDNFQAQSGTQLRALRLQSDSTEFLPDAPPAGTTASAIFPKTSLYMTPLSEDPIVMISPNPLNFPQVLLNQSLTRNMSIMNGGGGTAAISSVTLSGSPFFSILNPPTLPQNLSTGQNIPLQIQYAPTAAGNHSAVLTVVDNTTRLTHTVNITGNCMDPYIYTLPYAQNFDTVGIPNLPLDWQKIVSTTSQSAYVRTLNSVSHSTPNSVALYNADDLAANLLLIAPPLGNEVDITESRVSFFARSSSATSTMLVGVMTDPTDATTFVETHIITLSSTFSEFILSFASYTGTGNYVAFKHPQSTTYLTIYVDTVMLEQTPDNDLAALLVTGNTTPSVNTPSQYTIRVVNRGNLSQNTYQVKLFNAANDVELATAPGLTVAPDAIVEVPISWTPTVDGPMSIYGKVVLATDQNTLNDTTPPISLTVFPEGVMAVTIGSGDQLGRIPMDFFYRNSLFETIYYANEMTAFGTINTITFYNDFSTNLPNMPVKVWLGITDQTDLSADWIPATQLTLVYDGTVNFPSSQNNIILPLQTPFTYAGGNLVMMVNRPMDTTYYSSLDRFRMQAGTELRSRNVFADGTEYNPSQPPDGTTTSNLFPMTTFHMTPLSDEPTIFINPGEWDFSTVLLNSTDQKQFRVMNMGGGTLGINAISISGSPFFTLQNMPTLPAALNTGQQISFNLVYHPTAVGEHEAVITITDDQTGTRSFSLRASRETHSVDVSGTCIDPTIMSLPYLQNFDAVTAPALPVQWSTIVQSTSTNAIIRTISGSSYSEPIHVNMYNADDQMASLYLVAPPYTNTIQTNTTRAKFWARSSSTTAVLDVGVLTDPQNATTFTLSQSITLTNSWAEYVVTFGAYTGAGRVIAFRHGNSSTYQDLKLDNIMLEVIPEHDLAALSIIGNVTPTMGMSANYTVNVFNWGSSAQSDYEIKLYKQGGIEVASIDGANINPGQLLPQTLAWVPDAEGPTFIYAKVVMATDQNPLNDESPHLAVTVQPPGLLVFTIGDGSETARMPMDMYYMNSLYECIYYPEELGHTLGMIYGVAFYNNFVTDLPNMPVNVWLGTTTQNDLSGGYIPSTELTQVFTGNIDFPSGQNLIHIPFAEPFLYLEGDNLVLMVQRPMDAQYYSSLDVFQTQNDGSSRARNAYSDGTTYDPASPPTGTATGIYPKTSFYIIPGGVGHIQGTVTGANSQALPGVSVQFTPGGYSTVTNANGEYSIINIIADDYSVNFDLYGHVAQNHNVTIPEDETVTLNVSLQPMATVSVSGTIVASDTGAGLAGALIHLSGYQSYDANSTATGSFSFPSVYANLSYEYTIMCPGYTNITGTIAVGATNHNMGTITLNEIAYAPHAVVAELNAGFDAINLSWEAPDPTAIEITESFEDAVYPPADWSQIITNNGPINSSGVYPTWCRFGSVSISGTPVNPTHGQYQSGLWWSYEHQDEWLITPSFNCPSDAYIAFDSYVFLGSENNDHYYVKVSTNNGNTWNPLWDASTQTGGWNYYSAPITVDLSDYAGSQIMLALHAVDPPSNDGLWYTWFVDNIYIGNALTSVSFNPGALYPTHYRNTGNEASFDSVNANTMKHSPAVSNADTASKRLAMGGVRTEPALPTAALSRSRDGATRVLTGYRIWRLSAGQEGNEAQWTQITDEIITTLSHIDDSWTSLPNGTYRWAIKAIYTAGVASAPSFSNSVVREQLYGTVVGFVRRGNGQGIPGATVSSGTYSANTNNAGAYSLYLPAGVHAITAAAAGFHPQTIEQISVIPNQNITLNFVMVPVSNEDEVYPVLATELKGNIPNPFNPSTTILYDILEPCAVKLDIYNARGQKIRTLINEAKATGHHSVVFDGKDDRGQSIASGVYFYRFTAGKYTATHKMLLME